MKLSVVIPVYNERGTVREIIEKVIAVNLDKEIIVVDDGSTDGTKDVLANLLEEHLPVKIFYHDNNLGKGAAVRTAVKFITGDVVIIQDADLEYNPQEYPQLIRPILDKKTKVVYGSRILNKNNTQGRWDYFLGGRLVTLATNVIYGSNLTDEPTCYKVFDAALIKGINIESDGFSWEPEITAKILKAGYKIIEIPVSYKHRAKSEGKKIKYSDGIKAIFTIFKYRFKNT